VIESPKADFSVGNACNLNPIQFTFTGTKPPSPITTTFLWDFNGETTSTIANPLQQLKNTGNKAIQLKVTASNGCIDIITKNINIKPQAKANFDVEDVCEDSQAVFINKTTVTSGKPTYRWYFGDGKTSSEDTPSHTFNIAGVTQTFNVKLAADIPAGCSDSVTKAVTINANPKQGFSYTISGQTVNFTAIETIANTYQWTFGDGGTASTNNRQKSYTYSKFPSGKYTACLRVINLAGCISDSCMEILITGGVQNLNRNLGIQIYPNPNTGNFNIEIIESKGKSYLEIYNQVGQTLYIKELVQSLNTLDLKLANGMYLIRVTNGENVYNSRIIISH
jgi:PKD repeat protein